MDIKFSFDWGNANRQHNPFPNGIPEINEMCLRNLPTRFSDWQIGLLLILPAKIFQDDSFVELDVLGEVTELLLITTPSSRYDAKVSIRILKPYTI